MPSRFAASTRNSPFEGWPAGSCAFVNATPPPARTRNCLPPVETKSAFTLSANTNVPLSALLVPSGAMPEPGTERTFANRPIATLPSPAATLNEPIAVPPMSATLSRPPTIVPK